MIVPMKKVFIVLLESKRRDSLAKLKKLGVVHVEKAGNSSPELEKLLEQNASLHRALSSLKEPDQTAVFGEKVELKKALDLVDSINSLTEKIRLKKDETEKLSREIERLSPWGDFNPETLKELMSKEVFIRLYELKKDDLKQLTGSGKYFTVFEKKAAKGVAWVARKEEEFPAGIEPVTVPVKGLDAMKADAEAKTKEVLDLEAELSAFNGHYTFLKAAADRLDSQIEFEQVAADLGTDETLAYLLGFVPEMKVADLKTAASSQGWALLVQDPSADEPVPTLIKNSRWIKIIQPVFDLLGTVPGYRERDISFFFLLFFSMFFAMIIGDAAYGSIILALSLYFSYKEKKKSGRLPDGLILLLVMSFTTVVWGAITGNWFGFKPISQIPPFSFFIVPAISSWNPRSSETVKFITFVIGTVHISIAHLWNFLNEFKKKPRIRSFAQIGWLSMVLGLYFFVLNLVLDPLKYPIPDFSKTMIGVGFLMVLLLSQQEGNFFKGIIKGLGSFITTALNSISAFSDIISYIRLFAVGLAGIEIAKSFNAMSEGLMTSPLGIAAGILVVVFGHGLNMAMSGLSVVVHGVRLNMLEFSNHLGLEWSGFSYKPFQESEIEKSQPN